MEDIESASITTDSGLMQANPIASRDEQLAFIDTLKNIQSEQNQQIQDTTHALGSDVPAQFGGINGPSSYWLSRYQTPQTESRIATLRTAAQSAALNTALNNYLGRLQEDYNNAYRRANKRSRQRSSGGGGGNVGKYVPSTGTPEGEGDLEIREPEKVPVGSSGTTVPIKGHRTESFLDPEGNWITRDMDTGSTLFVNGVNIAQATLNQLLGK